VPKNTRPVACTMTSASESTTTRNVLRDPAIPSISMLPLGSVAGITLVRPADYFRGSWRSAGRQSVVAAGYWCSLKETRIRACLQTCRQEQWSAAGFSRCAATGKPRRLKPFTLVALVASLNRLRKKWMFFCKTLLVSTFSRLAHAIFLCQARFRPGCDPLSLA
jgi:hypothetical protein